MTRSILVGLAGFLAGAAVLLAGLLPSTLRTGQVVPADWLMPGALAIAALALLARRDGRAPSWPALAAIWMLATLPVMLLILTMASRVPWRGLALLAAGFLLVALAIGLAVRRSPAILWPSLAVVLALTGAARWIAAERDGARPAGGRAPAVAIMSALPLQGAALGDRADPLPDLGARSPLWRALERRLALHPLDALDAPDLAGVDRLLLAQPRLLAPAELVALDDWVRAGGQVVILADPLLHWPDGRPLGDPRRPPLTSLLDPLLAHWGLRLEPAQYDVDADPVERRLLDDGTLLQLAGASRFTRVGSGVGSDGARCDLAEAGLVAQCRIGRGRARLIADADWLHDALWTHDPGHLAAPAGWTSDAIAALAMWLSGNAWDGDSGRIWLIDQNRLISGLRAAFGLLVILAGMGAWMGRAGAHDARDGAAIKGRIVNKTGLYPDSA